MKETPTELLISSTRTSLPFWNSLTKRSSFFLNIPGTAWYKSFCLHFLWYLYSSAEIGSYAHYKRAISHWMLRISYACLLLFGTTPVLSRLDLRMLSHFLSIAFGSLEEASSYSDLLEISTKIDFDIWMYIKRSYTSLDLSWSNSQST